jgi:hypothetical protein
LPRPQHLLRAGRGFLYFHEQMRLMQVTCFPKQDAELLII